jgi:hypothetical protein
VLAPMCEHRLQDARHGSDASQHSKFLSVLAAVLVCQSFVCYNCRSSRETRCQQAVHSQLGAQAGPACAWA